jgi:hypothetical protein
LYRLVKKHGVRKIFELGIEDLERTWRLLRVSGRYAAGGSVKYAALDEFESRREGTDRLALIDAHRGLQSTTATVRLVPGPPAVTLAAVANSHLGTDLVLISSRLDDSELSSAWTWMPRMLHERSVVIRTTLAGNGRIEHRQLPLAEVSRLAEEATRRAAA